MIGRPFLKTFGASLSPLLLTILLLARSAVLVAPEMVDLGFNMILDASSAEIYYVKGFLQAPASIDLSHIRWITNLDLMTDLEGDDQYMYIDYDDTVYDDTVYDEDFDEDYNQDDDSSMDDLFSGDDALDVPETTPEEEEELEEEIEIMTFPPTEKTPEEEEPNDVVPDVVSETEAVTESEVVSTPEDGDVQDASVPAGEDVAPDGVEEEGENADEDGAAPSMPAAEDTTEDTTEDTATQAEPTEDEGGANDEDKEEDDGEVPLDEVDEAEGEKDDGQDEEPDAEEATKDEGEEEEGEDVTTSEAPTVPPTSETTIEERRRRALQTSKRRRAAIDDQIVDVAVFPLPKDCETDSAGDCDWVLLGVGAYDDEMQGGLSYCCSQDTADRGICNAKDIGTLMTNSNFEGEHRKLKVPSHPFMDFQMKDALFEVPKSGQYVTLIANCNDDGLSILTLGYMEWKSVGGYLPGDLFGLMFFYGGTAGVYLLLGLWYYYGMKIFQDAAIPIQKYILGTVVLGFFVTAFRGGDMFFWNLDGSRSPALTYIALTFGILFQGSLRCLGVMVAQGWGVVGDDLEISLGKIAFMGLLYATVSLLRDSLVAAASYSRLQSTAQETEYGLAHILTLVIFLINFIFYYWIITSVKSTTAYLQNMNQTSKLKRHLRLRCLVVTSLIIVVSLTVVNALQLLAREDVIPMKPFLSEDQVWILDAVGYGNYFFILFGVTILWRPNSNAKDYEMQMQLPGEENDLTLTAVVPSADDWEDEAVIFDEK